MNRLRKWLARAGLAFVTIGGTATGYWVVSADPAVEVNPVAVERFERNGDQIRTHVVYRGANGVPSELCTPRLDCDPPDAGWASAHLRAMCEQRGVFYLDSNPVPLLRDLADGGVAVDGCDLLIRQTRKQKRLMRKFYDQDPLTGDYSVKASITVDAGAGGLTVDGQRNKWQALNRWARIANTKGFDYSRAELPPKHRRAARLLRWAGHPKHELDDENDAGVIPDGGDL